MSKIIPEPSIIAADPARIAEEVKKCEDAGVTMLHVDIMDGHFVPNLTYGPSMVAAIKKVSPKMVLDVHLMVYQPFDWIEPFAAAGANHITFHLEATEDVEDTMSFIKKCNMKVGLAIRPETSETLLLKYLDRVDLILIMTVNPGFGGQVFLDKMLSKVKFLREKCDQLKIPLNIQVDGGINQKTAALSVKAGATHLVCGTAFFKSNDYKQTYKELQTAGK